MNDFPPDVHLRTYDSDRFPPPHPFGKHGGYLFTVPGGYPDDVHGHTYVTDWEMAAYRTNGDGDAWEVRDVNGNRRVWGTGGSRREAIGLAFLEIARLRRIQAAEIGKKRKAAGLEPVPPYAVEITSSVTLVIAPTTIAVLDRIEAAKTSEPARYHVHDTDGGQPYVIQQTDGVHLRTTTVGVLHARCDHHPEVAVYFEDEPSARTYTEHSLDACWPCDQLPQD